MQNCITYKSNLRNNLMPIFFTYGKQYLTAQLTALLVLPNQAPSGRLFYDVLGLV